MAVEVLNMREYVLSITLNILQKLDSIYKREAHPELYQTSKMEVLWKCLIQY